MTTATLDDIPAGGISSTADLLRGISDGDPASWDEILRRYGRLVLATVRSLRLQEADALDAVQMTWLRLAEKAHTVQSPERLGGWLRTTARRECLRILSRGRSMVELSDVGEVALVDPSAAPEQHVIDAETARTLWEHVEELAPRRRALLWALFTEGPRPYAELSLVTGIPPGGIGPTRARALRELRNKLEMAG
ncbi:MAG TPA: sigma-70 family RNA polymerase sigma factor [Pseudonocardiaceae bacterium]|nr:sigma-70 family RNA polymerase sigma factor [Pseudonocardiaceae bacterium]